MEPAYRCDFSVGDVIDGRYHVDAVLGTGSFGTVYKVHDSNNVTVALKLIRLWEVQGELYDEIQTRFKMEYRVSRTDSQYFVRSYDFGKVSGNPYFTMEFCPRGTLSNLGAKAVDNLDKIAYEILHGLYDLHSLGLIHRDLKPDNVLIKPNGIAALTDFGIVGDKKKSMTNKSLFGRPQQVFGTYAYMSPEQAERQRGGVTYLPTTDIFSFGVMLYEILTGGYLPFGKLETQEDLASYQSNAKKGIWNYKLLRSTPAGVKWERVVRNCIQADYRLRYQSVADIIADIPGLGILMEEKTGEVKKIVVTMGSDIGKEYVLKKVLSHGKRMIRVGRETDNDIVLSDFSASFVSRYHFTLELDKDGVTWYVRDGQWRIGEKQWIESTNGTYLGPKLITKERNILKPGDVLTVGNIKILMTNN